MKIIHFVPALESGGVEQVVRELAEGLAAAGHENVVVSAGGRMVPVIEACGARHIAMAVGRKSPRTLFLIPAVKRLLLRERPDVVHIHSRMPGWVAYLAWRTLPRDGRPRLVTSVHGFHSVNAYSAIVTKGDRVVAVSNAVREQVLRDYGRLDPARLRVIPNAIDPARHFPEFTPSAAWTEVWRREFPELVGKYTLCLAARVTRGKGHAELIPVLKSLRAKGIPAHAVFVGEAQRGKERLRDEIVSAFAAEGLSDAVTWTGQRSDLREIMASTDVTVSPSLQPEAFGKTVLEAIALGRPVAGYAHGGVAEILGALLPEGRVQPRDTDALASLLAAWHSAPPNPRPVGVPYRMADMIAAHIAAYSG